MLKILEWLIIQFLTFHLDTFDLVLSYFRARSKSLKYLQQKHGVMAVKKENDPWFGLAKIGTDL